ncbi:MAG: hypothetical protein KDE33_27795, partial [Bacteroidetes bacterium]|nr:hypothetical protein [Bacteroidota bacterium]
LETEYYTKGKISKTALYKNVPFEAKLSNLNTQLFDNELELTFRNNDVTLKYDKSGEEITIKGTLASGIHNLDMDITFVDFDKDKLNSATTYIIKQRKFDDVVNELSKSLTITPINFNSNTVSLSIESVIPQKAQDIISAIATYYIKFDTERKAESIDKTLTFLNEQIENFGQDYYSTQDTLKKFKIETGFIEPNAQIQKNIEEITELERNKIEIDAYDSSLKWLKSFLKSENDISNLTQLVFPDNNMVFENSISEITTLQSKRNLKLLNVTPDHPDIILINKEINALKSNLINQVELAINKSISERKEIQDKINTLYASLYSLPDKEIDFSKIKRESDLKQQFYFNLIEQRNLYNISRAGIISDYIILEKANLPIIPIAPNDMMIWAVALFLAFFLGLSLIAIRYLLNQKVYNLSEVEENTNANILGIIPKYDNEMENSKVVVTDNIKSRISESFRSLRTSLEFINSDNKAKIIATTSTIPGEGKTFIGINLAAIYSLL